MFQSQHSAPPPLFFFLSVLTVFAVEIFSLLRRLLPSYAFMNICRVICLCALFERIVLKYQLFPLICLEELFCSSIFYKVLLLPNSDVCA